MLSHPLGLSFIFMAVKPAVLEVYLMEGKAKLEDLSFIKKKKKKFFFLQRLSF